MDSTAMVTSLSFVFMRAVSVPSTETDSLASGTYVTT
jgi:hypothetical protein